MINLGKIGLFIFDLDGTLAPFDSDKLYPDAAKWIEDAHAFPGAIVPFRSWVVATNQGGIGLRYWMEKDGFGEPAKYPTLDDFEARINKLFPDLKPLKAWLMMCARYQSKSSGKWSPIPDHLKGLAMWCEDWRKPAPGMLEHAMIITGWAAEQTCMVGDGDEDEQAAKAAGVQFIHANEFFGRNG